MSPKSISRDSGSADWPSTLGSPSVHGNGLVRNRLRNGSEWPMKRSVKPQRGKGVWRVLVFADNFISGEGIAAVLKRDSRFLLCASVYDRKGAEKIVESHQPDLVLLEEPFLLRADDFQWIKSIAERFRNTHVLIVSRQTESVYAERAFRTGACGYFVKTGGTAQGLIDAIERVLGGEKQAHPTTKSVLANLSDRELEVFSLIAVGHGVGQIAKQLGISRKTVETHCEHIKHKFNYADAAELRRGARQLLRA